MAAVTTMWPLKRYATFHQTTPKEVTSGPSVKGSWQEYYGNESPLKALLHADGQFVLTSGTTIMESINLRSADSWIRGTSKGDSVLIICKMKEETRRFRMQFSESSGQTEVTKCREFAERVSEYFPIKVISTEKRQIRGHIFNLRAMLRNSGKCYANMLKREVKAIKTMLILVCAFLTSWLPYVIISMYAMFNEMTFLNPWLNMLPSLFAKASVIWNPIIYLFINKSFRNALMDKIPVLRKCHSLLRDSQSRSEPFSNETMPTPLFSKEGKSQSFDQHHTVRVSNAAQDAITIL